MGCGEGRGGGEGVCVHFAPPTAERGCGGPFRAGAGLPPAPPNRCPRKAAGKHPAAEPASSRSFPHTHTHKHTPPPHPHTPAASPAGWRAPLRAGRAPARPAPPPPPLPRAARRRRELLLPLLLTVLLLGAGEGELAAEVGLGGGPLPPAGQGRCQQEQPEEEHWAGGARGCGTAGTGGAAPRPGRLSAAPGAGCAAGEKAALSLLWQQRIAG